ncbi:conserved Plasmodium protein, unknown function [Babesia microti strain RI]|uniref:G-patch domain-containing protein n=1 Tax=Babesia microti (strain RI) TaxID=1133968 RepID=A0A1R4AC61_BABMR|nr:conserved Plasmodium protein, unknown function [Babesia microti strain RI]SJK86603.1 conserved Plasmodium protein, unknown function [Babesia microti strain RI]|eukprot:XP_021338742.1 conserved Plasmodium protein, unknown function [Babesia microti strain RI]
MGKKKIMLQETAPKVGSSFGEKILRKYGWEDGKGLGKYTNGTIEPIVLQANSGCRGMGDNGRNDDKPGEWDDWWTSMYDNMASKITIRPRN